MGLLDNVSPLWIENQFTLWKSEPDKLSEQWRAFFAGFELGSSTEGAPGEPLAPGDALKHSAVQSLIYRYRDIGHLLACTDPLSPCKLDHPLLALSAFDLDASDLEKTFYTRRFMKQTATLKEIVQVLRSTYCGSTGVEFMHIQDPVERQWLIDRMEPTLNRGSFSREERLRILRKLKEAAFFERQLQKKFPGQTRFSLEGGDVLIPLLDAVVRKAAALGVSDIVLGMPHRGRLNVLVNIFGMPHEHMFAEFSDNVEYGVVGEGDVKYHKGVSADLALPGDGAIHLTLTANPSHLEAIDPVVEGKCRARQDRLGGDAESRVLPLLIHGDAAFAGQGVVAETLNLSQLAGYRTGGTLHIVLNNQIGFTTAPADARSSLYATDVAKMVRAPVFHVYGDDPEAVLHAGELALAYRDHFRKDVVLEVICYRRYGHNEGDEPYFTQPLMYDRIKLRPQLHTLYQAELLSEEFTDAELKGVEAEVLGEAQGTNGRGRPIPEESAFLARWSGMKPGLTRTQVLSCVDADTLQELSGKLCVIPEGFNPHPKVAALLARRREAVLKGGALDWGNVETLAFATLLGQGVPIRLSGQDARRGTFSHRHAVLLDQQNGSSYIPLSSVARNGASFRAYDSMLAEYSVLGFDYGYSLEAPEALTIWEAQYGDFANGAQVIIDQFIASGEAKWERSSGLVLMLPHGYEGQGAEHSSARMERFLALSAGDNLQIVNPSTPAQLFHVLRRQMLQSFRKPLILFTPKSLLRHPLCVSTLEDLSHGEFREVIADPAAEEVQQVLICTGKIYYDLAERIQKDQVKWTALVRVEQLYPLAVDQLRTVLGRYPAGARFSWVQEEPRNMGAWRSLRNTLAELLGSEPRYVGRPDAAAPASGSHRLDRVEQERIVAEALQIP